MRILIADDDRISCRILERKLIKWGYEVVTCSDGAAAWQVLRSEDAPQLAIIDWMMPGIDGLEVCRKVREQRRDLYTYILLLTANSSREDVIRGLDAGADDYLSKPFDSSELKVRLRIGRRILELEGGLLSSREALRVQATHDPLTGVLNRGAVMERLQMELKRAEREGTSTGLIMADLDNFKSVNDTHGHLAGDAVLRAVCRRMRRLMRPYDSIGRYGGEEFLILLSGCDNARVQNIADRICQDIGGRSIDTLEGTIAVTISIGAAVADVNQNVEANALIRAADTALYRSKREGRNRVSLATEADIHRSVLTETQTGPFSDIRHSGDLLPLQGGSHS